MPLCDKSSSREYFLNFTFKQTNYFNIEHLLRYTIIYNPETLFVISRTKTIRNVFAKYMYYEKHYELISDGELFAKTRFIKGGRELFIKLCQEGRNVHLLEFDENQSRVKWLEASVGADVAILRKHLMGEIHKLPKFEDFHLKYDRPVTIIFAEYGMGKTICLRQIKQNLTTRNNNTFILYVNDIQLREFYCSESDTGLSPTVISFVKFFSVDLINPDVHIMYDNFECLKERDDIINIMIDFHLNYRNVKQWIACSEIECRNKLESKLGTLSCSISPVSEQLQVTYLKKIWGLHADKDDEADVNIKLVLDQCNKWHWKDNNKYGLLNTPNQFCSYPLHLKMLASMFKQRYVSKHCTVSILDVYENFTRFLYGHRNIEEVAVQKLFENINFKFKFRTHEHFTIEFVNVINYLAAKWFSKNFHIYRAELTLLLENRFCSWSFQYFFDSFLCRGMPLHTAVLNHWPLYDLLVLNVVNERDAGGRTAMHLVNNIYELNILINAGAQTGVRDDVQHWTPLQYFDYYEYLGCLEVLLKLGADAHQLTWSLNLKEPEISQRFEDACIQPRKLLKYIRFICLNVKDFQASPKSIANMFGSDIPSEISIIALNHARKSNNHYFDRKGKTALFYAVQYGNFKAVKFLIHNLDFDIHHRCYKQTTAFHVACQEWWIEIADYLLKLGVDVNITHGDKNCNAFTDCCQSNYIQVMKFLIDKGININNILSSGETPLELACAYSSIDVVRYLCENATDLNITYKIDYDKLILIALENSSTEVVEFLLSQNKIININKKIDGKSILHIACFENSTDDYSIVRMLIEAGADVNAIDNKGCTPVFSLFPPDAVGAIEIFAKNGCNFSHFNFDGETLLHVVTKNCYDDGSGSQDGFYKITLLIERLITYEADVNAKTPFGTTPLHFASSNSNIAVIRTLVSQGADIHAENNDGESPLHLGCLKKCTESHSCSHINYLVSKGADVNKRTKCGITPIMYAVNCPSHIDTLVKLGADIFCKDNKNRTLVHYFAKHGLLNNLEYLAQSGMKDAKSVNTLGQTALHVAASENNFSCFQYLINHFDTDINIIDNNGNTATDIVKKSLKRCNISYF